MNYKKIYDTLCERGKERNTDEDEYYEIHHIIPKCMGGTNDKTNLTHLTYREHFLCHWLLHRIYPSHKKLQYAFHVMTLDKYGHRVSSYTPSSRQLEETKLAYISARTGSKHSKETRQKISEATRGRVGPNKGKLASSESKNKMSEAKLGWNRPKEHCNAISEGKKKWYKDNVHPNKGKTYKLSTKWDRSKDGLKNRIEQVKKLYESGTPITQIPKEVNVTRQAIYNWIKEYNWSR